MLTDPEQALAQAAAVFLDLTLDPVHVPGVCANLTLLRAHAARLEAFDLPPELDPAPVFVP